MTDKRPEPVAWWCSNCKIPYVIHRHGCSFPSCRKLLIPLYPASVVAGELYEMATWINKTFGDKPDGTHNDELDETVLELVRRGKELEAK